jgi:FkbM family methyltransferase
MSVLDLLSRKITGSRAGRYWLSKLSNHDSFQPLYDIMAWRVQASLRLLQKAGFAPEIVVDIGAHSGEWTQMGLPIFPQARFLMIEAQPEKEKILEAVRKEAPQRIEYAMNLLGAESKENVDFFMCDLGSSVYVENTSFPTERVSLPMLTLDTVLRGHDMVGSTFIKIDVQGAELDVLAGATETLQRTDAVLLEASLVEYNKGAPRIGEVIAHMAKLGFILFDICDLRRIGSVLAQTDLIFIRQGSALDTAAQAVITNWGA